MVLLKASWPSVGFLGFVRRFFVARVWDLRGLTCKNPGLGFFLGGRGVWGGGGGGLGLLLHDLRARRVQGRGLGLG